MGSLELTIKIVITLFMGWYLISNLIALRKAQMSDPAQFKSAERALKANKLAVARADLDRFIKDNGRRAYAFAAVIGFCARTRRMDLLAYYAPRAELETRMESEADRATVYESLAAAYLSMGNMDKPIAQSAVRAAREAMRLAPESTVAMNSLAYTLAETSTDPKTLVEARDLVVSALRIVNSQAGDVDRQLNLAMDEDTYGWALYKLGRYGPPKDAPANFSRAVDVITQSLNDMPEAVPEQERKDIYYHLGAAYRRIGRGEEARNALQTALHYEPENEAARRELQELAVSHSPQSSAPPPGDGSASMKTLVAPRQPTAFTPLDVRVAPKDGAAR